MVLYIFLTILFCICGWVFSLRRVVPTNEVHIIQQGKNTVSYGKDTIEKLGNVYYEFPSWLPYIGITKTVLPISVFDVSLVAYEAYDVDRLPFLVDIKAFFRIKDSNIAASRISTFQELENQITDIVRGSVRSIMANSKLEAIMSERSQYGQKFTDSVEQQLNNWGVESVKAIELMDVRDTNNGQVIANIMAKKTSEIEMDSRIKVAENMKKAREAEILSQQEVELKQQESNEKVGKRKAEVEKTVGVEKEKANQSIKEQAKISKEKEMEVLKVEEIKQAEIHKESAIITANATKEVTVIQADASKTKTIIDAEALATQTELKANADLIARTKEAEGIKAKGLAEAESKKASEMATVTPQIELAKEIGENQGYQQYLVSLEQIKALCEVGIAQAKNLGNAQIKINTMSNDIPSGLKNVTDIFSPSGGLNLAGCLENLSNTEIGKKVIDKITK